MQKILLPLFGLAALASSAAAEPIPMTDDQLDLVVAGLKVTYDGKIWQVDHGVLVSKNEDGTLLVIPLPPALERTFNLCPVLPNSH